MGPDILGFGKAERVGFGLVKNKDQTSFFIYLGLEEGSLYDMPLAYTVCLAGKKNVEQENDSVAKERRIF